ncbi:MAG TPA: hypothetical protein ENG86_07475 [Nitrospirae bacterium]|nr:hypothetical protein [Nitrospirota bacterium]HDO22681.1 hypothetical protein [Nitrospirota bacterium]
MTLFDLKKRIKGLINENNIDAIACLALEDRRALNVLTSFSYDRDSENTWRAIDAMGRTAGALIDTDYDFLRDVTRRLLWSVTEESGGIGWSSIDMLGEIVRIDAGRFRDLIPVIASMYEDETFRESVIYALSRIADISPELIQGVEGLILDALSEGSPRSKVYALRIVKKLRLKDAGNIVSKMVSDETIARIYSDGYLENVELGSVAGEVYESI